MLRGLSANNNQQTDCTVGGPINIMFPAIISSCEFDVRRVNGNMGVVERVLIRGGKKSIWGGRRFIDEIFSTIWVLLDRCRRVG